MQKTSENPPRPSFGLLLVGPPKSGKSSFALQFPNAYIADCDNNISGPLLFLREKNSNINFSYDTIDIDENGKEVPPGERWMRLTAKIKEAVTSPEIDTIIIDSLSKVSDYLIEHILRSERIALMRIQDWGSYQNLLKKLITYVRSSGKLFILTAHEAVEKDELDGILKYFIALPSSLKNNIGGFFTDVWRAECEVGKGGMEHKYVIRAASTVRMSLGNSLRLPATFPMDYSQIEAPMDKLLSLQ